MSKTSSILINKNSNQLSILNKSNNSNKNNQLISKSNSNIINNNNLNNNMIKKGFKIQFGPKNKFLSENEKFPNNKIMTTKYSLLTWAPKSLLMQFKRAANIYFLIVTILTFCSFSPINPASMVGTFVFVLLCTMIKEALEDYGRYRQDKQSNNRLVWKYNYDDNKWIQVKCWTLMPGEIIKVIKNEEFSADTLIIKTSNDSGYCYIETKSLDGETNLKERVAVEYFKNINNYENLNGFIECDLPNENLNYWNGKMFESKKLTYCKMNNLILKGCVLKNTEFVIGIIIYSGKNTKIMKNQKKANFKMSKVLNTMNKLLYSVFIFEIILCIIFGYLCLNFENENQDDLGYIFRKKDNSNSFIKFLKNTCTYFVSYSNMIPISLYVVLEIIKIFQGFLIKYDDEIYDETIDKPAGCRTTDLIEELGQIEFIFSDKTGTLTQNNMVLKKIYINFKVYGNIEENLPPNTKFTINGDSRIEKRLRSNDPDEEEERKSIENFILLLALCHEVFPEKNKKGEIIYQGASPDEISLVKGAQQLGYEYESKNFSEIKILDQIHNVEKLYDIKIIFPFDSNRKRMTVIVFNKSSNEYELLCKGADTSMMKILNISQSEKDEINRVIKVLSKEGLRVLVMAKKILNENHFVKILKNYESLNNSNNEKGLNELYNIVEKNLNFVGCSAIEDKLQDGVSETIYTLLTCNIKIWVLTGDKQDTAEEIAKSCKLINENMETQYLVYDEKENKNFDMNNYGSIVKEKIENLEKELGIIDDDNFNNKKNTFNNTNKLYNTYLDNELNVSTNKELDLNEIVRRIRKKLGKDLSLIVDGITLEQILKDSMLRQSFFHIAFAAKSVICCRTNPKQKSRVVQLVKTYGKWITLAIGDGANDVPMIMEAHIGIGIQGKEGTQAVRSADFSIGQFRFLEKLLLNYGRIGYIKISKFICYYFYKNILLVFSDVLYAFSNGFSGQLYFPDYLTTMYNAIFTSWCCLFIFSLERDVKLEIIKKFPILYSAGPKNYFFNLKEFWTYIICSIIHGFVCFYLPELSMLNMSDETGITYNHWYKSTVNFSLIIHVVSYKLLIISDFWNWVNLTAFVVSICFYYLCLYVLCLDKIAFKLQNELAGVFMSLICKIKFWILIVFGPFMALILDITLKQIHYNACPIPTDYIKQHLDDPLLNNIIHDDNVKQYSSVEAKKAENKIKEILKKARMKKKLNNNNNNNGNNNNNNNTNNAYDSISKIGYSNIIDNSMFGNASFVS